MALTRERERERESYWNSKTFKLSLVTLALFKDIEYVSFVIKAIALTNLKFFGY